MKSLKSTLKGALEAELARIPQPVPTRACDSPDNQVFSLRYGKGG